VSRRTAQTCTAGLKQGGHKATTAEPPGSAKQERTVLVLYPSASGRRATSQYARAAASARRTAAWTIMDQPSDASLESDGATTVVAHLIGIVRAAHVSRRTAQTCTAGLKQGGHKATTAEPPGSAKQERTVLVLCPSASGRRATPQYARAAASAGVVLASLPSDPTCGANQTRDGLTTASAHLIRIVRVAHALGQSARTGSASPRQGSGTIEHAGKIGSVPEP